MHRWFALIAAACSAAPLAAQEVNCISPQSQVEMTYCAGEDYEIADQLLNATYKRAMARAREMDAYLVEGDVPAATLLRDAQRAWIPFRDRACETESLLARGGTMQNQIFLMCMTRLTDIRREDLELFSELN